MKYHKGLHIPVLKEEVLSYLRIKNGMTIVDCTVGAGGHARKILEKIGDSGRLIGLDRDKEALAEAEAALSVISDRFRLFHSNYSNLDLILRDAGISKVDGALFDLGISSLQIDRAERGFSIKLNGPLDMRMDKTGKAKASDIINRSSMAEIARILKEYGDEYFAHRISKRIIQERKRKPIETTAKLAEIVTEALPYRYRFRRIHPATKTFMALRIAVNQEIESLRSGLEKIVPLLNKGSRICVISFHSIEDRIVKNTFKEFAKHNRLKIITKKPIRPNAEEAANNPKSRSAKLRVAETE